MRIQMMLAVLGMAVSACGGGDTADAPAAAESQSGEAAGAAQNLAAIPEDFQGRWDFAEEDCSSDLSDMRLTVAAQSVDYYESSAQLSEITQTDPRTITAVHEFSGEGEEWQEMLAYALNEDGGRLTVTSEDGSMSIRMRCP